MKLDRYKEIWLTAEFAEYPIIIANPCLLKKESETPFLFNEMQMGVNHVALKSTGAC